MRLFVAIVPSAESRQELADLQKQILPAPAKRSLERLAWDPKEGRLVAPVGSWRPAPVEQMHLTLQFLGNEVNLHQKEEIKQALLAVPARHSPFEMAAGGLGAFPSAERASVLWAGLESDELSRLAEDIASTLSAIGIRGDKPFTPHITIARSKSPQDARALLTAQSGRPWSATPWRVGEFVLFESSEVLGGREHCAVEKYRLAGPKA